MEVSGLLMKDSVTYWFYEGLPERGGFVKEGLVRLTKVDNAQTTELHDTFNTLKWQQRLLKLI